MRSSLWERKANYSKQSKPPTSASAPNCFEWAYSSRAAHLNRKDRGCYLQHHKAEKVQAKIGTS